jgi:hypothetical protein
MPEGRLERTRRAYRPRVIAREDCPVGNIYFLPSGLTTWDPSTGRTTELLPGIYVNPRNIGVITDMK